MGKVVVAQGRDLIKTSARIDISGQEIDPKTKQIIESDAPYVPTKEDLAFSERKKDAPHELSNYPTSDKKESSGLTELIDSLARKKIENINKLVDDRVGELLKELIK